jgi:hypothetical protein
MRDKAPLAGRLGAGHAETGQSQKGKYEAFHGDSEPDPVRLPRARTRVGSGGDL